MQRCPVCRRYRCPGARSQKPEACPAHDYDDWLSSLREPQDPIASEDPDDEKD